MYIIRNLFCIKEHFSDHSSHTAPMMFEPEISIRRLFKCCETLGCTVNKSIARATLTTASSNQVPISSDCRVGRARRHSSSLSNVSYKCDFCTFSSTWKYDLKIHLKQKHNVHRK